MLSVWLSWRTKRWKPRTHEYLPQSGLIRTCGGTGPLIGPVDICSVMWAAGIRADQTIPEHTRFLTLASNFVSHTSFITFDSWEGDIRYNTYIRLYNYRLKCAWQPYKLRHVWINPAEETSMMTCVVLSMMLVRLAARGKSDTAYHCKEWRIARRTLNPWCNRTLLCRTNVNM